MRPGERYRTTLFPLVILTVAGCQESGPVAAATAPDPQTFAPTVTVPHTTPHECRLQREAMLDRGVALLPLEWDGTAIRVDVLRNFPAQFSDADLTSLLVPIAELADTIEAYLGYRIIEAGGLIDVPGDVADFNRSLLPTLLAGSALAADPGSVLIYHFEDAPWSDGWAAGPLASTMFHNGPVPPDFITSAARNHVLVHELFHLLGFNHHEWYSTPEAMEWYAVAMELGSLDGPWLSGSERFHTSEDELTTLGCLFPRL